MEWWFSHDGFMARTTCGRDFTPALVAVSVISNLIIFLCYIGIPAVMVLLFRVFARRGQLPSMDAISVLCLLGFIVSCGLTHAMDALMFVLPVYRVTAAVLALCAVFSLTSLGWFSYRLANEVNRGDRA